jgi:hypothetical protein
MQLKSQKDFFSGLVFMVAGGAFALGATHYEIGRAARMGPGYFPLVLGSLLALLGMVITFKALVANPEAGAPVGRWAWKPLFSILGANLAFGLLLDGLPRFNLPAMGLVTAIYALTLIASLGGDTFKLKEVLGLASALALISYLVFVGLLKLQLALWPVFLTA